MYYGQKDAKTYYGCGNSPESSYKDVIGHNVRSRSTLYISSPGKSSFDTTNHGRRTTDSLIEFFDSIKVVNRRLK